MSTREDMLKQLEEIGYDYIANDWFCVETRLLSLKRVFRNGELKQLSTYHFNICHYIDDILRNELNWHRNPSQKYILFHSCDLDNFEDIWFDLTKTYYRKADSPEIIPFGTFQAVPHYIDEGPNTTIKYTEQCSRCKVALSRNIIGCMQLRYVLE